MKICIFGGTFDPIHLGHENIINILILKFDKVIIMPSKKSPGKNDFPIGDSSARFKMLSLCDFANESNCIISDYELESNKIPSYTIDTIKYIKNKFKNSEIYLAVGLDQLNNLNSWHKSDKLLSMVKIICFNRSGVMSNQSEIKYEFIKNFNYNISSSDIRTFIQEDDSRVKSMINENIFNYIIKEKLYI